MENLTLTKIDREILQSYCALCDGLSVFLGSGYEIVLHSLENLDHAAIRVINGFHTGRSEGAPITDLALKMLEKIRVSDNPAEYLCYFSENRDGKPLKSTTIPIRGERGRVIGLLCMNFYLDTPFIDVLSGFFPRPEAARTGNVQSEAHMNTSEDLVARAVARVRQDVFADPSISAANKNKEIIYRLYEDGIFKLKDAVNLCANQLCISKNTVYMHIRSASKK